MTPKARTPEWYALRRSLITSTDIPAILGISPWRSEGDVAREKAGVDADDAPEDSRRLRIGLGMEDLIRDEDALEHGIALRRVSRFIVSTEYPWAGTSLDFERVGERTIVEAKTVTSRRWDDGLPEYVEAQVRWQMGVARYPRAHVATIRYGTELVCYDLDHDPGTWDGLVIIAEDFRARMAAGGPFMETRESVRRAWPRDDGSDIIADAETADAVRSLIVARQHLAAIEERESALAAAIQTRMGPASTMTGPGFRVTWKQAKDSQHTDYKPLALDALGHLDPPLIETLMARHTTTRPGTRRFIVKETRDE